MIRAALLAPLLLAAVTTVGCSQPKQQAVSDLADERNGRVAMAFDEFGFRLALPKEMQVCASMSGTHPHGFFSPIDGTSGTCDLARDAAPRPERFVAAWADHNAMGYRSLKDAGCTPEVPNAALTPMVDKWQKLGMEVEQCTPAGSRNDIIELKLLSPGREAVGNETPPHFLYTFRMKSPDRHFGSDLSLFARMLESAEFGEPG